MNELFAQEGNSIYTFKVGQIITRVKGFEIIQTHFNENLGVTIEAIKSIDNSYFGKPVEYLGIKNNRIYLKEASGMFKDSIRHLSLFDYADHWSLFELPDGVDLQDLRY